MNGWTRRLLGSSWAATSRTSGEPPSGRGVAANSRVSAEDLPVIEPDRASARRFGAGKATLAAAGRLVADADLLIAAIALGRGGTLVTGNRKPYERLPGLGLEDWLRA